MSKYRSTSAIHSKLLPKRIALHKNSPSSMLDDSSSESFGGWLNGGTLLIVLLALVTAFPGCCMCPAVTVVSYFIVVVLFSVT